MIEPIQVVHPFDSAVETVRLHNLDCDGVFMPVEVMDATTLESLPPAYAVLAYVKLSNFLLSGLDGFETDASRSGNFHNHTRDMQYLRLATDYVELQRLSLVDSVTGYMNRDGLYRWANLNYDPTTTRYAIFAVDLKKFKIINDVFGHPKGDEALKRAAHEISSQIRAPKPSDTYVGHADEREHDTVDVLSVARIGGDEFTFVMNLNGLTVPEAEAVIARVSDYLTSKAITVKSNDGLLQKDFGFKVGYVMTGPDNPINFEEAIVQADLDLMNKQPVATKTTGRLATFACRLLGLQVMQQVDNR